MSTHRTRAILAFVALGLWFVSVLFVAFVAWDRSVVLGVVLIPLVIVIGHVIGGRIGRYVER